MPRRTTTRLPAPQTPTQCAAAAADAITQLCATQEDATREVDARGGQLTAWLSVGPARARAAAALGACIHALTGSDATSWDARRYMEDMLRAVSDGIASPAWALRVVALVQAAEQARADQRSLPGMTS